ncbi:MAG: Signal recognition particle 54 kDa protein [Pseudomonadota bacterium]
MELRRILARDLRAATEKAVALYGDNVLVISNDQVHGQTEVIVAVELEPDPLAMRLADRENDSMSTESTDRESRLEPRFEPLAFGEALNEALASRETADQNDTPEQTYSRKTVAKKTANARVAAKEEAEQSAGRDQIRAREIVDLVRQEMAILRRDLRLGQSLAVWGQPALSGVAQQFDQALSASHAPLALRTLITSQAEAHDNVQIALAKVEEALIASMGQEVFKGPLSGIHVVMGPSGAGKTSTAVKLAAEAAQAHGTEQVAVLSWCDSRLGAWAQIQMGCSKIGVDCFRAQETSLLLPLLEELRGRSCVIIDTPGIEMNRHRGRLQELISDARFHLVVPMDAASHQAEQLLKTHDWTSLMVTKVDEAVHGWGLISALSHRPLAVYPWTGGTADASERNAFGTAQLARMAMDHLAGQMAEQARHAESDRMSHSLNQLPAQLALQQLPSSPVASATGQVPNA